MVVAVLLRKTALLQVKAAMVKAAVNNSSKDSEVLHMVDAKVDAQGAKPDVKEDVKDAKADVKDVKVDVQDSNAMEMAVVVQICSICTTNAEQEREASMAKVVYGMIQDILVGHRNSGRIGC